MVSRVEVKTRFPDRQRQRGRPRGKDGSGVEWFVGGKNVDMFRGMGESWRCCRCGWPVLLGKTVAANGLEGDSSPSAETHVLGDAVVGEQTRTAHSISASPCSSSHPALDVVADNPSPSRSPTSRSSSKWPGGRMPRVSRSGEQRAESEGQMTVGGWSGSRDGEREPS
jgi:hypothetical protein